MHNITINVKEDSYEYLIDILSNIKDVSVIKDDVIDDDSIDVELFEEAKKDTQGAKSIDEMIQDYHIES